MTWQFGWESSRKRRREDNNLEYNFQIIISSKANGSGRLGKLAVTPDGFAAVMCSCNPCIRIRTASLCECVTCASASVFKEKGTCSVRSFDGPNGHNNCGTP